MLSSSRNGSTSDGHYRELDDEHNHNDNPPQNHELGNMTSTNGTAHLADSDMTTTAGSTTTATMHKEAPHPRKNIAGWKWQGTLAVVFLTSLVNGAFSTYSFSLSSLPSFCSILRRGS